MTNNILFITHVGNPGGAEIKMLKICQALKKSVTVLQLQEGSISNLCKNMDINSFVLTMPKEFLEFKRTSGLFYAFKMIPKVLFFSLSLQRFFKKYDVLVCMSQKAFVFSVIANFFTRAKLVWYMNDLVSEDHFNTKLVKISIWLSNLFADHVVLNSHASREAWVMYGGNSLRSSVSFSGVDIDEIDEYLKRCSDISEIKKKCSPDGKPLIGIFGRISEWKGQDVFIQTVAKMPNVRGLIVGGAQFGEEDLENRLKSMVYQFGADDRITFVGHSNEVPLFMAACDVIAHCSTKPEPFGRTIVEAMLCSKPVIATNAGGAKEIIVSGVSGELIPMNSIDDLIGAISKCICDKKYAELLSKNARTRGQLFSSRKMINDFKTIVSSF